MIAPGRRYVRLFEEIGIGDVALVGGEPLGMRCGVSRPMTWRISPGPFFQQGVGGVVAAYSTRSTS